MAVKTFTVKDGEFTEYMKRPLVSGDVGAYKIVLQTDYDLANHNVRITAKRSDGVILEDVGTVSGKNAVYTLKSGIYSVAGEVEVRIIVSDNKGNCLTEKSLIFDVVANHQSGDMQTATDNGKSVADLALAHMNNFKDPHNTRELLGFDDVLADIEGKLDFEVIAQAENLPDIGSADMNKIYLVCEKNDDWSVDNTDAVRYDLYIKTESYQDSGAYAWTKLAGRVPPIEYLGTGNGVADAEYINGTLVLMLDSFAKSEHTHTSADIADADDTPTVNSENLVKSGGVAEALETKLENYGTATFPSAVLDEVWDGANFDGSFVSRNSYLTGDVCSFFTYRVPDVKQYTGLCGDFGAVYRNEFYVAIAASKFDWTNNKIYIFNILPQLYVNNVIDTHIHVRAGYLSEDGNYLQTDNPIGAYLDGMELILMSNYSEADYILVMGYVDTNDGTGININGVRILD